MSTYIITAKQRVNMLLTVATIPHSAPVAAVEYYVYRSGPDDDFEGPHWKYFPTPMSKDELPDIRIARPLYIWNGVTGDYTPIDNIRVFF
jgi:hypothetical protein